MSYAVAALPMSSLASFLEVQIERIKQLGPEFVQTGFAYTGNTKREIGSIYLYKARNEQELSLFLRVYDYREDGDMTPSKLKEHIWSWVDDFIDNPPEMHDA